MPYPSGMSKLLFKNKTLMINSDRNHNIKFMVAPAGQFAYQNAYWLPDAMKA